MNDEPTKRPATVVQSTAPQQAGDTPTRWGWVEHSVWTPRMLTRLDQSEATTQWFRLWDKVWGEQNLLHSFYAVWRNDGAPGVDGQTVEQFDARHQEALAQLRDELHRASYQPQPARRVWIPKPGTNEQRPLGIPAVRDRVVQAALRHVLEPIFECDFAEHSYGFRPGHSAQQAVARVEELLACGNAWCVDADLKSYFDTIPHERLMELIRRRIVDGPVLHLLEQFLKAGVMETLNDWKPTDCGSPQGAVISPLLANVYLNPLDHQMAGQGWQMVRYADDFVVLCGSREEAQGVLKQLQDWTAQAGLTLHPTKTRIVNAQTEGFDFLGWTFKAGKKWPRKKSLKKLQDTLRPLTRRTSGLCLVVIIAKANLTLRGWRAYFHDSIPSGLRGPDGWLRRRLRALLRKREKRPGYGLSQADSKRWPNRWFAEQGLYSLEHGSCTYG